jgi:hypothetical protein
LIIITKSSKFIISKVPTRWFYFWSKIIIKNDRISFEYFRFENEKNAMIVNALFGDPEKKMKMLEAINGVELI